MQRVAYTILQCRGGRWCPHALPWKTEVNSCVFGLRKTGLLSPDRSAPAMFYHQDEMVFCNPRVCSIVCCPVCIEVKPDGCILPFPVDGGSTCFCITYIGTSRGRLIRGGPWDMPWGV